MSTDKQQRGTKHGICEMQAFRHRFFESRAVQERKKKIKLLEVCIDEGRYQVNIWINICRMFFPKLRIFSHPLGVSLSDIHQVQNEKDQTHWWRLPKFRSFCGFRKRYRVSSIFLFEIKGCLDQMITTTKVFDEDSALEVFLIYRIATLTRQRNGFPADSSSTCLCG